MGCGGVFTASTCQTRRLSKNAEMKGSAIFLLFTVLDQIKVEISQVQLILRLPTCLKLFPRARSAASKLEASGCEWAEEPPVATWSPGHTDNISRGSGVLLFFPRGVHVQCKTSTSARPHGADAKTRPLNSELELLACVCCVAAWWRESRARGHRVSSCPVSI